MQVETRSSKRSGNPHLCCRCHRGNIVSKMGFRSNQCRSFVFLDIASFLPSLESRDDTAGRVGCYVLRFSTGSYSLHLDCRCHLEMTQSRQDWNSIRCMCVWVPDTASCLHFLKANPEPIFCPAIWHPHDDRQECDEPSFWYVSHVWFKQSWQAAQQSGPLICVNPTINKLCHWSVILLVLINNLDLF